MNRVLQHRRARPLPINIFCSDDKHITTKLQNGTLDQSAIEQLSCTFRARFERPRDFGPRQFTDIAGDEARAEIAVGLKLIGWPPDDGGMPGQIDGIGDDRRGGVGL